MIRFHPYAGRAPLVLALLALMTAGCRFPGQPKDADRPIPPDRVLAFDALYRQNCSGCHGADGKLGPAPPLNDGLFRAIVPTKTVEDVVAGGRPGSLMPAFGTEQGGPLTKAQVAVLVNEIKGIPYRVEEKDQEVEVVRDPKGAAPAWGAPGPASEGAPPYLAAADAIGDAAAGRSRFATACASCHGDHGQGVSKDGRIARAINEPAFLSLISDQNLRRIMITGRSDLGMPDYAHHGKEALTPEDVLNLVAFLRTQGNSTPTSHPEPAAAGEAHHDGTASEP
ncbi:MAG TPA: c-type cytochrome [Gemmataceae bacterium]|nr:c-type cytochrome [Gemmataceae bacterium]